MLRLYYEPLSYFRNLQSHRRPALLPRTFSVPIEAAVENGIISKVVPLTTHIRSLDESVVGKTAKRFSNGET